MKCKNCNHDIIRELHLSFGDITSHKSGKGCCTSKSRFNKKQNKICGCIDAQMEKR